VKAIAEEHKVPRHSDSSFLDLRSGRLDKKVTGVAQVTLVLAAHVAAFDFVENSNRSVIGESNRVFWQRRKPG